MAGMQVAPSASALERAFRYNRPWLHLLLAGAKVATGQMPKEVIWARNKTTLYAICRRGRPGSRSRAAGLRVHRPAVHLGPDPGQHFVEYLVQQGFDVYLLDWGIPGGEDQGL